MAPSLELYEKATEGLPVKPVVSNVHGVSPAVADLKLESSDKHDRVLKVFRAFIADLCQQFNGGHPG